ncbi:MAG: hypothetical protein LBN05_06275 [Oscillospiraceae bacterium]|jgi:type III secretory pathway component EscT|nr:hypothetical protein [Oscillospiraceae bacterium]
MDILANIKDVITAVFNSLVDGQSSDVTNILEKFLAIIFTILDGQAAAING